MIYSCFERENGKVWKFPMNDFCYFEIRPYIMRCNPLSIAPKSVRIKLWDGGECNSLINRNIVTGWLLW